MEESALPQAEGAMPALPKHSVQIGVSRPPLQVEELPAPEQVFGVKRMGLEELILFALGPGVIALGLSFGNMEWMIGPLTMTEHGFKGLGWLLLASLVLQIFYNVELARFTLATGEPPILAFGRLPPGRLIWTPLALILFYAAYIWGDWALIAGASLFSLITGRVYGPDELNLVRLISAGLLLISLLILSLGRKAVRTLAALQGIFLSYILLGLILLAMVVVPAEFWMESLRNWITPALPPEEVSAGSLGALVGFMALASGLNFIFIGYYRDQGLGMGSKTGYISGLIGGHRTQISPSGKIFAESQQNAARWKRWFRYLVIDQWALYFIGALASIIIPSTLAGYLANLPGATAPSQDSILVYMALGLGQRYGSLVSGWTLVASFVILFSTQIVILELLARNLNDAILAIAAPSRVEAEPISGSQSPKPQAAKDARSLYYPILAGLVFSIGVLMHITLPESWTLLLSNLPNLAAMIFPLAAIYLNRKLPRPARITWWSYLVLLANVIFFGYFFIDFLRAIL